MGPREAQENFFCIKAVLGSVVFIQSDGLPGLPQQNTTNWVG